MAVSLANSEGSPQELEMTPLIHSESAIAARSSISLSLSNAAESKGTDDIDISSGVIGSNNCSSDAKSEEGVPDIENGADVRDTESLLPPNHTRSSSVGSSVDRGSRIVGVGSSVGGGAGGPHKKAVLADTLRFLFLGLPG